MMSTLQPMRPLVRLGRSLFLSNAPAGVEELSERQWCLLSRRQLQDGRTLVQSSGSGPLEGRSGEALEECPVRRKWDTRQSSLEERVVQRANPLPLPRGLDAHFLVALFAFAAAFSAFAAE